MADQGGIIAMARDDEETSQVMYTVDEGENWRKIEFKEFGMNVDSFVTELSGEER